MCVLPYYGRSATLRGVEVRTVPSEVGKVVWLPQPPRADEMGRVPLVSFHPATFVLKFQLGNHMVFTYKISKEKLLGGMAGVFSNWLTFSSRKCMRSAQL